MDYLSVSDISQLKKLRDFLRASFRGASFNNIEIDEMDEQATEFWGKWKDWLRETIEMSPALPTKEDE